MTRVPEEEEAIEPPTPLQRMIPIPLEGHLELSPDSFRTLSSSSMPTIPKGRMQLAEEHTSSLPITQERAKSAERSSQQIAPYRAGQLSQRKRVTHLQETGSRRSEPSSKPARRAAFCQRAGKVHTYY